LFDEKLKMPRTKNKIQQVQEDKATVAHEEWKMKGPSVFVSEEL
jgi:hypothetical protein